MAIAMEAANATAARAVVAGLVWNVHESNGNCLEKISTIDEEHPALIKYKEADEEYQISERACQVKTR
jgi:hypothetical protein